MGLFLPWDENRIVIPGKRVKGRRRSRTFTIFLDVTRSKEALPFP
jgi:hypothetical protein